LLIEIYHSPPPDYPPPPWLLLDLLNINAGTEPPGHNCTLIHKDGKTFCAWERKRGEVDEVPDDDQSMKLTTTIFTFVEDKDKIWPQIFHLSADCSYHSMTGRWGKK
jgi:hypothetical protein